jgi:ribonuclease HI
VSEPRTHRSTNRATDRDLWERLFALVDDEARDVSFVCVKGNADEADNEVVDRLSREASQSHPQG